VEKPINVLRWWWSGWTTVKIEPAGMSEVVKLAGELGETLLSSKRSAVIFQQSARGENPPRHGWRAGQARRLNGFSQCQTRFFRGEAEC
jgi:hypothetical protein